MRYPARVMERVEFLNEFRKLEQRFVGEHSNVGCVESYNLNHCSLCMFSTELTDCFRCTHCSKLSECTNLTHSDTCQACHHSSYLVQCRQCLNSHYLLQCIGCSECNYCVGCVGLTNCEYHILNRPYERSEYFEIVTRLKLDLGFCGILKDEEGHG